MILNTEEYKKYLPLQSASVSVAKLESFETNALNKHFPFYIGMALTVSIAGESPDAALLAKVKPVLANLSYMESVPFFDVVATSTGFGVVSNSNIAPASKERVANLKNALLLAANDYMDQLLYFLEQNQNTYSDWNKSSLNEGSLIADATTFSAHAKQEVKRPRFIKLIPILLSVEYTTLYSKLSAEFLAELVAGSDANVKPTIQKALVNMVLGEEDKKDPRQISMFTKIGEGYLAKALSYLKNNLTTYATYNTYGYEAPFDNDDDENEDQGFFIAGCPS